MKLSIIVPVYQVKQYLARCLDSIIGQTFQDFEVVLVDDGSTDGSADICDQYAERYDNFKVIHKNNGGLSSARNAGIDVARGKYIMFIDSDDMIHCRTAELELILIEDHCADAVICSLKRFEKEDEIDLFDEPECEDFIHILTGIEVQKEFFNNQNASKYVSSCGKVFKKELFDGICFPEGRLFEDEFTTYLLYYKCNKIVIIDRPLYFYYVNQTGITQNLNINKRFDEYDAQMTRIQYYRSKGNTELYELALREFLRSAQWDLMSIQKNEDSYDLNRGRLFQMQYKDVLQQAERQKLVRFLFDYDYYVLAYPNRTLYLRIKRMVYRIFKFSKVSLKVYDN